MMNLPSRLYLIAVGDSSEIVPSHHIQKQHKCDDVQGKPKGKILMKSTGIFKGNNNESERVAQVTSNL